MQWYSNGSGSGPKKEYRKAKSVLTKELADQSVLDFIPVKIEAVTPQVALAYLEEKKRGSDFRMNEAVRIQTGLEKLEKEDEEQKIEESALLKLKEIQEKAYQEAYAFGLEEGKKEAFQKASKEIFSHMEELDRLFLAVQNLKKDLIGFNESHLVTLTFLIASRIAKMKIDEHPEVIVEVLRDAVGLAQDEEQINVQVAQSQFDFLEKLKLETGREFEFIKKIKFEGNPDISVGGCILETNYGEVDARLEQRVDQLWSNFSESLIKVKNRIAG